MALEPRTICFVCQRPIGDDRVQVLGEPWCGGCVEHNRP